MLENDNPTTTPTTKHISSQLIFINKNIHDLHQGVLEQQRRVAAVERQIDSLKHISATLEAMIKEDRWRSDNE